MTIGAMTINAERAYRPLGKITAALRQIPRHQERGRTTDAGGDRLMRKTL
jgi:hypothetical protein